MANDSDTEAVNVTTDGDMDDFEDEECQEKSPEQTLLQALQGKGMMPFGGIPALPPAVKKRIKALKKLQLETFKQEAKFFEEVHALECKYYAMYSPNFDKRKEIIVGSYEPAGDECDWPSDNETDAKDELSEEIKKKLRVEDVAKESGDQIVDDCKGIPDFWLTIFRNVDLLSDMVQHHDEPLLKHLNDIKIVYSKEPLGFVLEFYFSPNEYFTNHVLSKTYLLKCYPDESDPFSFEGPEIYKCQGCEINWNKGKNLTLKTIKKKQKHKSRGVVRIVTRTVQNDSFFNFFSPPTVPDDPSADVDEHTQELLTADFEVGHFIRERIVPRAVLFYTGEALEDEEDEEDDDYEEEEDEGDEGDDFGEDGEGGDKTKKPDCSQQ